MDTVVLPANRIERAIEGVVRGKRGTLAAEDELGRDQVRHFLQND